MPNRQLVDYVHQQLAQGIPLDQIRLLLVKQGWSPSDVTAAVDAAVASAPKKAHKEHHTHFVGVAVLGIIVLLLIGGALLMVFGNNSDNPPVSTPVNPIEPPTLLTGWAVCAESGDGYEKDACYQELHHEEKYFDCSAISDSIEKSFCQRAKETVLIDEYNAKL